ncbi:MAG: diguanylate cyclase [Gammaproteobacteria bacterium]|nr:diguanylate cyclase [Gammaproteobacteria bacterium]MCW8924066.1 diguanylate cyclase [Gammaproteobacteria bacterium]
MQILLKYLLLIEPDRQRLSRFVLYAVEELGGNVFSATLLVEKCMKQLFEAVHVRQETVEVVLSLDGEKIYLALADSACLISELGEMPPSEKVQEVSMRLKQESELADPEVLRQRNARITEDLERAKAKAAEEMKQLETELEYRRIELEQAQRNAEKDSLTDLYNHGFYDQRLEEAMARCKRQGEALCLLMLDVDKFKEINDTHGHVYGDEYLKRVADSMNDACRTEVDYCCRLGGDEFAIIIFSNASMSERIAKNILKSMDMNVSIGIAQMLPDDTVKTFSERCDQALYEAKENGRGQVAVSNIRVVDKSKKKLKQ